MKSYSKRESRKGSNEEIIEKMKRSTEELRESKRGEMRSYYREQRWE